MADRGKALQALARRALARLRRDRLDDELHDEVALHIELRQEALVRAWLRRDSCRSPGAPLPWLLEITRNEARRLMGRQARRSSHELVTAPAREPDCEDRELAGIALRVSVEQALGTLADGDRRLLRLRYAEDLTQGEVARRLGVPEGTVKVRLHRARRRLRALLAEQC